MHRLLRHLVPIILILFAIAASRVTAQERKLSSEGEARRAAHAFLLGDFAEGKKLTFVGGGPTQAIDEIVISREHIEVTGELDLKLPPGSQRVASMFRYVVLRGEGLDNLEGLVMLPYASNSKLAVSTREPNLYRAKVAAMPIPSGEMPPIRIRSRCRSGTKAVITEVAFNSQGKLPAIFDDIPYRNLGSEHPRERVEISIETDHELSIGGHVELEREKFCRYYAAPGNLHPSFERWAAKRNFLPGRQILKLQPALVVGYAKRQPILRERTDRPGAADLTFFDRYENRPNAKTIEEFGSIDFAMCFNDYPEFMSIAGVGRGTPQVEHFGDAAELASAFVEDQIRDGGRTATWWEVKNESTIKSEWDYHWRQDVDSWGLLADFHNRVAQAVHQRAPTTKVGGPSSAWMQLQAADFGLYHNQARFMDLTAGKLDFYSHHFYEDTGSLGAWERREGKYTNYLLGRLEATLDMITAHMHETDNVRPILITECGSLQAGRGPSDYWLRLRTYSAYMHKFMRRPEQIDLAVPFAFLSIPWNPQSGDAAFIPREGKPNHSPLEACDPTPVHYLFELWRDFDGRRLPVHHDKQWLDVTAVHSGARLQVALTNMGGRQCLIDLRALTGDIPFRSVSQRRLYYRDGEVRYEDSRDHIEPREIPLDVEETTIISIELDRPLDIRGQRIQEKDYAAGTGRSSDRNESLEYELFLNAPDQCDSATLVIGVHREGGLGGDLRGSFNGSHFETDPNWASEFNHLFAPIEISIPIKELKRHNRIDIEPREKMTITSVHLRSIRHQAGPR